MLKPTAVKNLRGRITHYQLDCAGILAEGTTKVACLATWHRQAEQQARHTGVHRYDHCTDGSVFHLCYRDGWVYFISRGGHAWASSCFMGRVPRAEAERSYFRHLAQYNDLPSFEGVAAYDRAVAS